MPEFRFKCHSCGITLSIQNEKNPQAMTCPKCQVPLNYVPASGLVPGSMIDSTVLINLIKTGDSGELWLGEQGEFKRKVAIKLLTAERSGDEMTLKRFAREAKNIAKLDHPNIAKWIDYGEDKGIHYIITAYPEEGMTLKEYLSEISSIPERKALKIIYKTADAMSYAWEKHTLVHRNIKPANILVDGSFTNVQLIDFSLSKMMHEDMTLTMVGSRVGSCGYMSQELLKGRFDIDCRVDIYSLGITLFYMLSGRLPFDGKNADEIIEAQINQKGHPITDFCPNLSHGCIRILKKMTAYAREERYQNWNDLKLDITKHLTAGQTQKTPVTATVIEIPPPPSSHNIGHSRTRHEKNRSRAKMTTDLTSTGSLTIKNEAGVSRSFIAVLLIVVGLTVFFAIFMFKKHSDFKKQKEIEAIARIERKKQLAQESREEELKARETREATRKIQLAEAYEEALANARHTLLKSNSTEMTAIYLKKAKKSFSGTNYEVRLDEKIKLLSAMPEKTPQEDVLELLKGASTPQSDAELMAKKKEREDDKIRMANAYEEAMTYARHIMKKEENPELVVIHLKKARKTLEGTEYEVRLDEKIKLLSGIPTGTVPDNIFEILRSTSPRETVPEFE